MAALRGGWREFARGPTAFGFLGNEGGQEAQSRERWGLRGVSGDGRVSRRLA
jgi:hypothetical protein